MKKLVCSLLSAALVLCFSMSAVLASPGDELKLEQRRVLILSPLDPENYRDENSNKMILEAIKDRYKFSVYEIVYPSPQEKQPTAKRGSKKAVAPDRSELKAAGQKVNADIVVAVEILKLQERMVSLFDDDVFMDTQAILRWSVYVADGDTYSSSKVSRSYWGPYTPYSTLEYLLQDALFEIRLKLPQ